MNPGGKGSGPEGFQTQPLNQLPYPAQSPPYPGQVPVATTGGGYPHATTNAPNYAHPPPPPPYDANSNVIPPAQTAATTYVQVVTRPQVGPDPASMVCPSCTKHVITRLDYETSTKTHIAAGLLCLFICWPCFWIPYVIDSCKNANHYCPNCGAYIGTYRG
ncbi:lipopolysaccharide-induced tumor necrosis factor-alpha factor-like [Anopheles arabiensis]|uniref:AGAP009051-PA n=5 Tax=gambiae species complex TaxID=44542 RepID=A7UV77_ANOGA|nr:lipopolysaccharide-induced tumor necrosis factor-alpha factor-like [Anopheles arabiensis]XP_040231164.1 lipopolysaccharide-induced tumor necrosis factor-alpha factor-like isoform X2 [Anopheles coluzzii]EDO63389.1 AGAP009051-PA [Anopheles gambiae str. PEST]